MVLRFSQQLKKFLGIRGDRSVSVVDDERFDGGRFKIGNAQDFEIASSNLRFQVIAVKHSHAQIFHDGEFNGLRRLTFHKNV